jgi:hypothetical protein
MAYTSEEKLHYYNTPGTDAEGQIERLRARKQTARYPFCRAILIQQSAIYPSTPLRPADDSTAQVPPVSLAFSSAFPGLSHISGPSLW